MPKKKASTDMLEAVMTLDRKKVRTTWYERLSKSNPEAYAEFVELAELYVSNDAVRARIGNVRDMYDLLIGNDPDRDLGLRLPEHVSYNMLSVYMRSLRRGEVQP